MSPLLQTYSTGRYGIVDLYYRHIWINHWNEDIMHEVRRAFWSKVTTAVFDLAWFDNYSDDAVDSTVSLNWKIPICQKSDSRILKWSLTNHTLFNTQIEYESKILVNEPTQCNLTVDRQHDLQNQMLLLISILEHTCLLNTAHEIPERPSLLHWTPERQALLLDIRNIFLTEIDTGIILERLSEVASLHISGPQDASAKILKIIGKSYE